MATARSARPGVQRLIRPPMHRWCATNLSVELPAGAVGGFDLVGEPGFALAVDKDGLAAVGAGEEHLAAQIDALALPGAADDEAGQAGRPVGEEQVLALDPSGGEVPGAVR